MSFDQNTLIFSGLNSRMLNGHAMFVYQSGVGFRPATSADFAGGGGGGTTSAVRITGDSQVGITGSFVAQFSGLTDVYSTGGYLGITGVPTVNIVKSYNLNAATINSQMVDSGVKELLSYNAYSGNYISGNYTNIKFKIWNNSSSANLYISEYTGTTGTLVSSNLFTAVVPPSGLYENNIEYFGPVMGWYSSGNSGLVNATVYSRLFS